MKNLKQFRITKILVTLSLLLFISSCSNEEIFNEEIFNKAESANFERKAATVETEITKLIKKTRRFQNFNVALDQGLIDVSGYVPNMGHHYLNPALSDGAFEINKPEIILYVPDENDVMQMVGVEYSIIPADPNNPGSPPEGFTGDQDVWHFNEMVGQWQLHVWTILENPDGIFSPFNPAIGD